MIIPFAMTTTTLVLTSILGVSPLALAAHQETNVAASIECAKHCYVEDEASALPQAASLLDKKAEE